MSKEKKYYLGIDAGTDSVGFCVTDENYNIVKKHRVVYGVDEHGLPFKERYGQHLWGARLFDEASTAKERRLHRGARRRYQRRRWRINLLQGLFNDEMNKVDENFFPRLNCSAYHDEDTADYLRKKNKLLFGCKQEGCDVTFSSDKDYFKKYPTIYHLRKDIIEHPEHKYDIRLIYLALAHMIKYRGNFLHDGDVNDIGNKPEDIKKYFDEVDECLQALNELNENENYIKFNCTPEQAEKIAEIFKDNKKVSILQEKLKGQLNITDKTCQTIISIIAGSTSVKVQTLFNDFEDKDTKIEFDEDKFEGLASKLSDEQFSLLSAVKQIYDVRILINLLKGKESISNAMVDIYKKHNDQLKELKSLIKTYAPDEYTTFFRKFVKDKEKDGSYASYVGFNNNGKGKERRAHLTDFEKLYKKIKVLLPNDEVKYGEEDYEKVKDIYTAIETNSYLQRINSKENGVFPYQLNLLEMDKIIENQSKYYPFLADKAADYNNEEKECYKIDSILKFKIPYYVGPLKKNDDNPENRKAWVVRNEGKDGIKIDPWNFHEVINEDETEEKFIDALKNNCTYLYNEPTLPKNSLLYSMYNVLNELNNLVIIDDNGLRENLTKDDKQYLLDEVYYKQPTITIKKLNDKIKDKYDSPYSLNYRNHTEEDVELHSTLKSWIDFKGIFGEKIFNDRDTQKLIEKIIYDITIFEDKKILKNRLKKKYGIQDDKIEKILHLSYKGWGNLSRKLLLGSEYDDGPKYEYENIQTGEWLQYSIIDIMYNEPMNFMEVYNDKKYGFKQQVEDLQKSENIKDVNDFIDHQYISPMMKRTLRQTMKIVEELKGILKIQHFDGYFIEATRQEQKNKKKTKSRKEQLKEVYKEAQKQNAQLSNSLEAELEDMDDDKLRIDRIFLYFMQLGRSVYTGKVIDLKTLLSSNNNEYDIDHIIPQSLVKDDSFNNRVLVEQERNRNKGKIYPIPDGVLTSEGREWVKKLNEISSHLMPKEKMQRILRSKNYPLTDNELKGFINRQLTSTNQSVKAIVETLRFTEGVKDSKINYSRASNVSDFRKLFDIPKVREINDFHHAHDAYLNIVVGNTYKKYFSNGDEKDIQIKREYKESLVTTVESLFTEDLCIFNRDTKIWFAKEYERDENGKKILDKAHEKADSKGTIDVIRKNLAYNDPMVTQMPIVNVGKQGFFNKISIHTKDEGNASFPLKAKGPFAQEGFESKYGGYTDLTNPYCTLVKSKDKKKYKYTLEFIPTIVRTQYQLTNTPIEKYLVDKVGLKEPEVFIEKILIKSLVEMPTSTDKGKTIKVAITGKTGNNFVCINQTQLITSDDFYRSFKKVFIILGNNLTSAKQKEHKNYLNITADSVSYNRTTITKEETHKMFEYIVTEILKRPEFTELPKLGGSLLKIPATIETFDSLPIYGDDNSQLNILNLIVELLNCKSTKGRDISSLGNGIAKSIGDLAQNKALPPHTRIVIPSVTGFYRHVIFTVPEDN